MVAAAVVDVLLELAGRCAGAGSGHERQEQGKPQQHIYALWGDLVMRHYSSMVSSEAALLALGDEHGEPGAATSHEA